MNAIGRSTEDDSFLRCQHSVRVDSMFRRSMHALVSGGWFRIATLFLLLQPTLLFHPIAATSSSSFHSQSSSSSAPSSLSSAATATMSEQATVCRIKEEKNKRTSTTTTTASAISTMGDADDACKENSRAESFSSTVLAPSTTPTTKSPSSAQKMSRSDTTNSRPPSKRKARKQSSSDSVRRIQREWEDMVEAGMGYDWVNQRPVRRTSSCASSSSSLSSPPTTPEPQHVWIGPLHRGNLRIWHFSFMGVQGSPYAQGFYHGRLRLPPDYPYSPPRIQVWTPSGRFQVRTDVCLSASHYHPETWTSTWTIRTLTQSLRLHMLTQANEIGGLPSCSWKKRAYYAQESRHWKSPIGVVANNKEKNGQKTNIWADHAHMLEQGLFPLNDVLEDDQNTTGEQNKDQARNLNNKKNVKHWVVLDDGDADEEEDESMQSRRAERSSSLCDIESVSTILPRHTFSVGLRRLVKRHIRLALWGFVFLFVLLNRPF